MGKVFNKVVLLIVLVTIGIMFIRLLTVIIPQNQASVDPSAGISYLNERETAVYTEASPTPEPTQPPVSCGENAYENGGACYCNDGYTGDPYSACHVIIPDEPEQPEGGEDGGGGESGGGEG